MRQVVLTLLDMVRLRAGPQDLPASAGLALVLALAYVGQGFFADRILGEPDTAPRSLIAIAVQFGTIITLLNINKLSARTHQTISALAGTGLLFGLVIITLLLRFDPEQPQAGLALLYLALFLWSLIVDSHIYRHALSVKMSTGILIAVLIFSANFMLLRALFG